MYVLIACHEHVLDIAVHYNHNIFYMSNLMGCVLNVTTLHPVLLCTNVNNTLCLILILCNQLDKDLNLPHSLHVYQHHGLVAK